MPASFECVTHSPAIFTGYKYPQSGELVVVRFKLPHKPINVRLWEIVPRLDDSLCSALRVVRLKSTRGQIVERVISRLGDAVLNDAQAARACKTVKEFAGL
ncbi:hypothetical protein X994_1371 [Burkholderia pseudomallei]|nr:hypothetical protein X994_1371 [Burkholderia pseudomallei]